MKLAVYIPTESPDGEIPEYDRLQVMTYAKRTFAETYGGYTIIEARGGWMGSTGLVEEDVSIVYTFTNKPNLPQLRNIGRMVCNRLKQDAAAIEHSGDMEFITIPDNTITVR